MIGLDLCVAVILQCTTVFGVWYKAIQSLIVKDVLYFVFYVHEFNYTNYSVNLFLILASMM